MTEPCARFSCGVHACDGAGAGLHGFAGVRLRVCDGGCAVALARWAMLRVHEGGLACRVSAEILLTAKNMRWQSSALAKFLPLAKFCLY